MASLVDESDQRLIVASSDTHVGPLLKDLRAYCPGRYLPDYDAFVGNYGQTAGFAGFASSDSDDFDWDEIITPAHYDVDERLRQLDADGVAAEVLFHGSQNGQPIPFIDAVGASFTSVPGHDGARSGELSREGMHIYNRWLADFCTVEPERHVGLAQVPVWDIDAAVREVEWAREAGLRGVNFPAPRATLPDFNDPVWDRFWSACAANEMPLDTHGGSETLTTGLARYQGPGGFRLRTAEAIHFSSRGLAWLIYGGVFERHPTLRFILTEVTGISAWLPLTLLELDELHQWKHQGPVPTELRKRPSEYFASNCFIGASFMSGSDARGALGQGLVDNYLWGSDFPHREGTYPWSVHSLRMAVEGIPRDAVRRLVGANLVELFQLDQAKLQKVADRIGPTIAELATPLPRECIPTTPASVAYSLGFREGTLWV